jgi:hypothetical protein
MSAPPRACHRCGQLFAPHRHLTRYCPPCWVVRNNGPATPGIYRFICPDGRSYVGGVSDLRNRGDKLARSNARIDAALARYPSETWSFEILQRLPPGCSRQDLRRAEQNHIDRLRTWEPEHGFNVTPAVWDGDGPAQRAGRTLLAERNRECIRQWHRMEATLRA